MRSLAWWPSLACAIVHHPRQHFDCQTFASCRRRKMAGFPCCQPVKDQLARTVTTPVGAARVRAMVMAIVS